MEPALEIRKKLVLLCSYLFFEQELNFQNHQFFNWHQVQEFPNQAYNEFFIVECLHIYQIDHHLNHYRLHRYVLTKSIMDCLVGNQILTFITLIYLSWQVSTRV